jgi:hypothetical protein
VVQIAASFGRAGGRCARSTAGAAAMPRSSARLEIFIGLLAEGQVIESAAQYNRTRGQRPPDHLGEES